MIIYLYIYRRRHCFPKWYFKLNRVIILLQLVYCNDGSDPSRTECEKQYRKSHLGVNVYLNQRTSIHYFEVPAYDVSDALADWLAMTSSIDCLVQLTALLSEMGGIGGILAGISGISLAELLFALVRIIVAAVSGKGADKYFD